MKNEKKIKEPSIIIRPIGRFGGLDSLHIMLAVVAVLLFLLLLFVSYGKSIIITANNTTGNCLNGTSGVNCSVPIHNSSQIKLLAERVIASYANINSSLSLLPYISNVSGMNINYLPESKSWYVYLKDTNPADNFAFAVSFMINDTNTSKVTPLLQTAIPKQISDNNVVALGVVQLSGKYSCATKTSTQVYWFVDPYAFGAVKSLLNASEIEQTYGSKLNLTLKVILGSDSQKIGTSVGLFNAAYLSKYALCASEQRNFSVFASALNSVYNGSYVSQSVLASIANSSSLNYAQLSECINASSSVINTQSLLAQYYGVTQTPIAVVNCQYMALPQTVENALCFANSTLC